MKTEIPIRVNQSFTPFLIKEEIINCDRLYRIFYNRTSLPNFTVGEYAVQTRDFTVYEEEPGDYIRFYHSGSNDTFYAVSRFIQKENAVYIQYLPEAEKYFTEAGNSFFHIEWEKLLNCEQRMILHAACIQSKEAGGILFAGPSGAGKSTQADLWCHYAGAVMLNGDRTILCRKADVWKAFGSPYAGSSKCYVNAACSINAVVFVKKAPQCRVRRMGLTEAFQRIYGELTVNSWDKSFVNRICDLTEKLIVEIPVYEMECTPDIRAVEVLYNKLRKEKH